MAEELQNIKISQLDVTTPVASTKFLVSTKNENNIQTSYAVQYQSIKTDISSTIVNNWNLSDVFKIDDLEADTTQLRTDLDQVSAYSYEKGKILTTTVTLVNTNTNDISESKKQLTAINTKINVLSSTLTNDISVAIKDLSSDINDISCYASSSIPGLIKTGYTSSASNSTYGIEVDASGNAYVTIEAPEVKPTGYDQLTSNVDILSSKLKSIYYDDNEDLCSTTQIDELSNSISAISSELSTIKITNDFSSFSTWLKNKTYSKSYLLSNAINKIMFIEDIGVIVTNCNLTTENIISVLSSEDITFETTNAGTTWTNSMQADPRIGSYLTSTSLDDYNIQIKMPEKMINGNRYYFSMRYMYYTQVYETTDEDIFYCAPNTGYIGALSNEIDKLSTALSNEIDKLSTALSNEIEYIAEKIENYYKVEIRTKNETVDPNVEGVIDLNVELDGYYPICFLNAIPYNGETTTMNDNIEYGYRYIDNMNDVKIYRKNLSDNVLNVTHTFSILYLKK